MSMFICFWLSLSAFQPLCVSHFMNLSLSMTESFSVRFSHSMSTSQHSFLNSNIANLIRSCHQVLMNKLKCDDDVFVPLSFCVTLIASVFLYLPLPLCFSLSLCLLLPLPIPSVCVFISFPLFLTLPIVIIICNARTIIIALLINLFLTPSEFVCGYIYLGLMYCNIRRQCYSAILGCNRRHSA